MGFFIGKQGEYIKRIQVSKSHRVASHLRVEFIAGQQFFLIILFFFPFVVFLPCRIKAQTGATVAGVLVLHRVAEQDRQSVR